MAQAGNSGTHIEIVPSGCRVQSLQRKGGEQDPHCMKPEGLAQEFGLEVGSKREIIEGEELR